MLNRFRAGAALVTTALVTTLAAPALAQTAGDAVSTPAAAPAPTDTRFNGTADQPISDIVVTAAGRSANGVTGTTPGGGLMAVQTGTKLRSTVTRDYIDKQIAAANVFTLVKSLPGVVVSQADAFGHSSNLSIRGLSQTSLGFNFEGMPAGDQLSYSAFPEEWADTENIGIVNLTRGSTDITAPVYNATGALLQEEMIDPPHKAGGYLSGSLGNHSASRGFLRLDTGDIGDTGIRGFVSGSHTYLDNSRGPGHVRQDHIDSKFVKDFANGSTIKLVATFNSEFSNRYRNPTLAQWNQLGNGFNFDKDFAPGDANYYGLRVQGRQSVYVSAPSTLVLSDHLQFVTTPYFLYTHGYVNGASTISTTANYFYGTENAGRIVVPAGTANGSAVENVDRYDQKTYGQNSYLKWDFASSQIRIGYWYSHFQHVELSRYELADARGHISDPYGNRNALYTTSGRPLSGFEAHLRQNVNGVYIDDTTKLFDDRLLINVGFKYVWIDRTATSPLPGTNQRTTSSNAKPLPQASIRYSFDEHSQIFADVTTAFRAPSAVSSYINIYNIATGVPSSTAVSNLNAEYSVGEEIGYRYHGLVNFTIAGFNYDLRNRLVQGSQIVNGTSVGFAVNVGRQVARGVEAEIGLKPWHGFSPYASAQYLHAESKDDYPVRGTYLPTSGLRAVLSPKFIEAAGVSYDNGSFFATIEGNHVGSQWATFMNDEKLPAFGYGNISVGYRLHNVGFLRKPQIQLNVNNFTNNHYLSGIQGVTSNAVATTARNGTVIAGSAPTYNPAGGIGVIVAISTGF